MPEVTREDRTRAAKILKLLQELGHPYCENPEDPEVCYAMIESDDPEVNDYGGLSCLQPRSAHVVPVDVIAKALAEARAAGQSSAQLRAASVPTSRPRLQPLDVVGGRGCKVTVRRLRA